MEDGHGPSIDYKLHIPSLDCVIELSMGGIIPEHIDNVVEVNECVDDGKNIHFDRIENILGDQVPNMVKFIQPSPLCLRNMTGIASDVAVLSNRAYPDLIT